MLYPYVFQALLARKGIKADKVAGFLACSILLFFMAVRRSSVGVDTQYYSYVYTQFAEIPWKNLFSAPLYGGRTETGFFTFDFEPGYRIANKLLSCFFSSAQAITVFNSVLILLPLYLLIRRDSPLILLSIWLYLTLGIYQTEMNVTRNGIAILICYLAFDWIKRKKLIPFLLCVFFAASFHQTALFFLPLYWLINGFHLRPRQMIFLISIAWLIGLNFNRAAFLLQTLLPHRYARYLSGGDFSIASVLVGVFNGVLFLAVWLMMNQTERSEAMPKLNLGIWLFTLNLCFFGLNLSMEAGARLAALFGPYITCLIPQMIACIKQRERRAWTILGVSVLSFLQFVVRLSINNIGGTMPYQFFWS